MYQRMQPKNKWVGSQNKCHYFNKFNPFLHMYQDAFKKNKEERKKGKKAGSEIFPGPVKVFIS